MTAGATILGCKGPVLGPDERAFFRAADPWGFILFSRNIENGPQLVRLTSALRDAVGRDAPIFIDQEGGRVARLQPPLARAWMPPLDQVRRAGHAADRSLWLRYRIISAELRGYGIDGNCVPIADIACDSTHPFLRNRCYGTSPAAVASAARAAADACRAGGVLPVLKHIPGHGRATADSHEALPRVEASRAELARWDFAPFAALSDLPLAMTAHIVFPALDLETPVTLSRAAIRAIRDEIGFRGLLMTDDISMGALSGGLNSLSAASIAAGCDVVLHCNGDSAEMEEVVAGAGRLSAVAALRAEAALACRHDPEPVDIAALEAELEALLAVETDG